MRLLKPGFPPRPLVPGKSSSAAPTTNRYSQSAWAGNMVMPTIWLGLPTIVIIALIIRSMKGD
jgi:heme/copper-type cytochrome/quinol oxidase subunit 2